MLLIHYSKAVIDSQHFYLSDLRVSFQRAFRLTTLSISNQVRFVNVFLKHYGIAES